MSASAGRVRLVCSECLTEACFAGVLMCDGARTASVVEVDGPGRFAWETGEIWTADHRYRLVVEGGAIRGLATDARGSTANSHKRNREEGSHA